MSHGIRLSDVSGLIVACGIVLVPGSAFAQRADWRALRIDSSTPESFQASVASLQNELSASARDDFETALAAIWIGNTTTGDIDKDGFFELGDVGELRRYSNELLADIHRGDLVAAIEKLDVSGDEYSTADYFAQLDGLGHEAVLDLAGLTDESPEESQALRAYKAQLLCRDIEDVEFGTVRRAWCDGFFRSNTATPAPRASAGANVHRLVGAKLNTAIEALNAGDTVAAEAAIDSLNLDRLTPYERGFAETLLFHVKYRQGLYSQAREHLQAAVDTQSMSQADADVARADLERFDRMITRPLPRPPGVPGLGEPAGPEGESASRD
jgi:hypothetical protein